MTEGRRSSFMVNTKTQPAKIAYSVGTLARELEVSECYLRRAIWNKEIRVSKLGRRIVIPAAEVDAYLRRHLNS